ncbi:MAG: Dam family site-specific DNA-(adenine-N6)-methyltransferase [Actinomycetota bacterium]
MRQRIDRAELASQAPRTLSAVPRAFLRWAGSKRALLDQIVESLPESYGTYYEPFLGSGSLFFLLQPTRARLSDRCEPLIETFCAVRDGADRVWAHLKPLAPSRELYYRLRSEDSRGRYKRAAVFIYLNKTCWNGLYRVNSDGIFNVPYGLPKSKTIASPENLKACSDLLAQPQIKLRSCDFEAALRSASKGDLVFLDPPYVTLHNNNGFVDYNHTIFSWDDQLRLSRVAKQLARKGVNVIVTNAYHDDVLNLYRGFSVQQLHRRSTIASESSHRRSTTEALLTYVSD